VNTVRESVFMNSVRDPGSWIQVPGPRMLESWIQGPGSRIQDPGSWVQDPGAWTLDPGSRILDPGSPGSWILDPGSRISMFVNMFVFVFGWCSGTLFVNTLFMNIVRVSPKFG